MDEYRRNLGVSVTAPTAKSPENNAQVSIASGVTFSWQAGEGAGSYLLEISESDDFASLVFSASTRQTNLQVLDLEKSKTYFWRVTAFEDRLGGNSAVSGVFSFSTTNSDEVVLYESFGDANFSLWSADGGTPTRTDSAAHAGRYSYLVDESRDVIQMRFASPQKQTVSLWLYDTMEAKEGSVIVANAAPSNDGWAALGVNARISTDHDIFRTGTTWTSTAVSRSEGWHELKWDYTGNECKMYIDGTPVHTLENVSGLTKLELGDFWGEQGKPGDAGAFLFDDLKIGDPAINPVPESVKLDRNELSLSVGDSAELSAVQEVTPDVELPLEWSATEYEIARVENGMVTANREGTTEIRVSVQGHPEVFDVCTVTVTAKQAIHVENIQIEPGDLSLDRLENRKLNVVFAPANATNQNVVWSSSDPNVVAVDAAGNVYAMNEGTATVTAVSEDGGKEGCCTVNVTKPVPKGEISNFGFETGDLTDWMQYPGSESEGISVEVVSEDHQEGTHAAKVTTNALQPLVDGKGYAHKGIQYRMQNQDGTALASDVVYRMTAWVKAADELSHQMGVHVIFRSNGYLGGKAPAYVAVAQEDGWVQLVAEITPEIMAEYPGATKLDWIIGNENTEESAGSIR